METSWVGWVVGLGFAFAIYVYVMWPTWKLRHIPAPPYIFGIGHWMLVNKEQAEVFVRLTKEYGPVYRFQIGRQPLVIVADAELCRQLGIKNFKSAQNRSIPAFVECATVHKEGLFFTKGAQWLGMRNILLPLFHSEQMNTFTPLLTRLCDIFLANLSQRRPDEDVNISDLFHLYSMDVIGESAFGTRFNLLDDGTAQNHIVDNPDQELVDRAVKSIAALRMDSGAPLSTIAGVLFPVLQHPLRYLMTKIRGTADWVQETSNAKLVERLNDLVDRREKETGRQLRTDALSLLLNAREGNPNSRKLLTPNYLSGVTYELLLAGSETTATTLAFIVYLLVNSERVEKKMLEEIDAFGPPDAPISMEDIDKFPYVDMIMKESMRLYTSTPVVARELSEDMELGGHFLPKGTSIWMALIAVFKDPKNFPNPEEFRPERFEPDSEESKKRHPYAFFPFGIGPRTCIGYKFANMEVKMLLIQIYRHYVLQKSPLQEEPLPLEFGMIVRPRDGIMVRVHRRHPSVTC